MSSSVHHLILQQLPRSPVVPQLFLPLLLNGRLLAGVSAVKLLLLLLIPRQPLLHAVDLVAGVFVLVGEGVLLLAGPEVADLVLLLSHDQLVAVVLGLLPDVEGVEGERGGLGAQAVGVAAADAGLTGKSGIFFTVMYCYCIYYSSCHVLFEGVTFHRTC